MPRNYVYMIIGALALVMISAGVYGMLNIRLIQANQGPSQTFDYSGQLDSLTSKVSSLNSQVDSLKTQLNTVDSKVNSINNSLTSLDMLKNNISDIHEKLASIQSLNTNVADIQNKLSSFANMTNESPTPGKILITIDKDAYLPGDTIHINALGAEPLKVSQIQLLDSNSFVLEGQTTWADSSGSIMYGFKLSSAILPGEYQIKISSGQVSALKSFSVTSSSSASTQGSDTLTAQTDKGIYNGGDIIQVTGLAQPQTSVSAVMKSPSGTTFSSGTTANSDGTYVLVFATSQSYEAGTWTITVTNLSQSKAVSIYLQSAGTQASSDTFTAQTDKASYELGDMVQVTGNAQPSSTVSATLTGPTQETYSSSTTVNSDGSYAIIFSTSTSYETGGWKIEVSNLGQSRTLSITMESASTSSGSYAFTANTDKSSYTQGELVQIAGTAQPASNVKAVMVSPAGTTYNTSAIANSNGDYVMFFSTDASYPPGSWYIEVSDLGKSKILSITMQAVR